MKEFIINNYMILFYIILSPKFYLSVYELICSAKLIRQKYKFGILLTTKIINFWKKYSKITFYKCK